MSDRSATAEGDMAQADREADEHADERAGSSDASAPTPSDQVRSPWKGWSLVTTLAVPLFALAVGIGVAAGVLMTGGGDEPGGGDGSASPSTEEIVKENRDATARVDTRGPGFENGRRVVEEGGGSGIVLSGGYVLTNAHVVAGRNSIKVTVGGTEANVAVRGQAPCEDLAVLELRPKPAGLKPAKFGKARSAGAGARVTALGYPGAFEEEATERRLQATDGTVSSGVAPGTLSPILPKFPALIRHTAPISPGDSGGPLLDDQGEVIGVNTVSPTGATQDARQNQNAAISIDRARSLLPDLEAGRDSGYVGWDLLPVDLSGKGVLFVEGVDASSPAARAGLRFGDVIVELDDTRVRTVPDVCDIVDSKSPGDRLKISGLHLDGGELATAARLR
jgi:S1-C subfamily serine protease